MAYVHINLYICNIAYDAGHCLHKHVVRGAMIYLNGSHVS